jgi:UDP-N-acetylglucosamine--N-acetylmuramyl-(pentapeptide) pyrophosphoryl-undecaprenol N-acetylglucosamine transferase
VNRSILLTGGGTGGHVYPALAIADAVRASSAFEDSLQFTYVGVRGGIEERIAERNTIPFYRVVTVPFPGARNPLKLIRFMITLGIGVLMAMFHLLRLRPDTVVATGGYVAAPAVIAAVILRNLRLVKLKIFVHEQNMRPGRLNSLVARFADSVGVSFRGSERLLRGANAQYVGYPVRPALREPSSEDPPAVLSEIPKGRLIVLAFGGSQGARTINRAVVDSLVHLQSRPDVFILHGVGRRQRSGYDPETDVDARVRLLQDSGALKRDLSDFYRRVTYIDDIGSAYRMANVVVCRGGAGTVKEVCAVGRPSIIIPKAGLAGDHQVMNAMVLEQAGAGVVLLEEPTVTADGLLPAVPGQELAERIGKLLDKPAKRAEMAAAALALDDPDAMTRIAAALDGKSVVAPVESAPHGLSVVPDEQGPEMELAALGPATLLGHVRRWRSTNPDAHPGTMPGFSYLRYRAASMLTASPWRVRNVGVKLVGLMRIEEHIPLLRHLFDDPRPAPKFARMCGGDREQNGFIRRNLLISLVQVGIVTHEVEAMVRAALHDRYFEARREGCRAIRRLPGLAVADWAAPSVASLTRDHSFEVRIAAVRAIASTMTLEDGIPLLRPFYYDPNWQLREAVLATFDQWVADGGKKAAEVLSNEFDQVLLTAGGYRPTFGLKETARRTAGHLSAAGGRPEAAP